MQKNKDSKKVFLKELRRKKIREFKKLNKYNLKNKIRSKIKEREETLKQYKESEIKIIAFMYYTVYGKMPSEGESLDMYAVKKLCKEFIKGKYEVTSYDGICRIAKRKIKEITDIELTIKYGKAYKFVKTLYKIIVLSCKKCYNYFIRIKKSYARKTN